MRVVGFCCLVAAATVACTSFSSVSDAGASEAATGADPATAPLLENGGFEEPGPECGPGWIDRNGTLTRTTDTPKSGTSACRLCNTERDGSTPTSLIAVLPDTPLVGPAVFELKGVQRVVATPDLGSTVLYLRAEREGGESRVKEAVAPIGANWGPFSLTIELEAGEALKDASVIAPLHRNECVEFDDLALVQK